MINLSISLIKKNKKLILSTFLLLSIAFSIGFTKTETTVDDPILSYTVDPRVQDLRFYWKDEKGKNFGSIQNLKTYIKGKNQTLIFAMNGGMYMQDLRPLGLFIQDGKTLKAINRASGAGNFYLRPNGVFYFTTDQTAFIRKTTDFADNGKIKYATQSGPILVIDGQINPSFKKGSVNLNIRNGVGILPGNKVVFAISKTGVNFYDFVRYFQQLGCKNALYLDGAVSRMYLPEKYRMDYDGNFGVIIGVTKRKLAGR